MVASCDQLAADGHIPVAADNARPSRLMPDLSARSDKDLEPSSTGRIDLHA
jgi:hypothetical protein